MDSVLVAWHSSKYVNVDHFRIFVWNWKALRKQSGSSQDGSRSVSGVQEQPQEVAEALPAAAKKGSKVQTLLVLLSSIPHFQDFSYFDIMSTIFYTSNLFRSHVICQASMAPRLRQVQKEPSVKMEAPTAAEACFDMRDSECCQIHFMIGQIFADQMIKHRQHMDTW